MNNIKNIELEKETIERGLLVGSVAYGFDDITWCSSECDNEECFRNPINMKYKAGLHSFADFKNKGECPVKNF